MADPIWTQADVDALKAAIRTGQLSVSFADRSVTYQSLKEMRALLADMIASVLGPDRQGFRLAAHDKGA